MFVRRLGPQLGDRLRRRVPRASDESGQALVLAALAMGMLIVCVGLVVDVGHAMLVQRQLQAGVDAAALAGVQHLPDRQQAETVAIQYSPTPGSKNAVNTVGNAATTATAMCIQGVPGCNRRDGGVNGIVVRSTSRVPTWFGMIIGLDHMTVSASATACSPCSVKPLDVMVVLDRTGSMCQIQGHSDPACTDLNRAKQGIRTFLTFMDPSLDKVGLALTPPTINAQMISRCPYTPWNGNSNPNPPPSSMNGRYYGYDQWWHPDGSDAPNGQDSSHYVVASLEGADSLPGDDYLVLDQGTGEWVLNPQSALVQRLGCTRGAGSTSYALAVEDAAVGAQPERPGQRAGRHHLPLGRRGEHVADQRADRSLDEQRDGAELVVQPPVRFGCRGGPRGRRAPGRSSTRSATTSGCRAARPSAASVRTATVIRTPAAR